MQKKVHYRAGTCLEEGYLPVLSAFEVKENQNRLTPQVVELYTDLIWL